MISLKTLLWWFGLSLDYVVAGGLIAIGIWCALYWQNRFARIIGMMLLGAGIGFGCFSYGKTIGGAQCYREWKAANEQAKIDAANRDIAMAKLARDMAEQQEQELRKQNLDLQKQLGDYADYVATIPDAIKKCRLAAPADVSRLCKLSGSNAPGCKGAK